MVRKLKLGGNVPQVTNGREKECKEPALSLNNPAGCAGPWQCSVTSISVIANRTLRDSRDLSSARLGSSPSLSIYQLPGEQEFPKALALWATAEQVAILTISMLCCQENLE